MEEVEQFPNNVPQPTPVKNSAHRSVVMSQEEDEETHVQHQYNLQPCPNLVNAAVSHVHSQPPGLAEAGDYDDISDDID